MTVAKTDSERMADMAKRKQDQGLKKISVSVWVPEEKADKVREAMKRAAKRELSRGP